MANTGKLMIVGANHHDGVEITNTVKEWVSADKDKGLKNCTLEYHCFPCLLVFHIDRLKGRHAIEFYLANKELLKGCLVFICDSTYGDQWEEITCVEKKVHISEPS